MVSFCSVYSSLKANGFEDFNAICIIIFNLESSVSSNSDVIQNISISSVNFLVIRV